MSTIRKQLEDAEMVKAIASRWLATRQQHRAHRSGAFPLCCRRGNSLPKEEVACREIQGYREPGLQTCPTVR